MTIHIGTSGFSFPDWAGVIYPPGLNKQDWLSYYERELGFSTLEVNYTYYSMPTAKTLSSMSLKTSTGFTFSVKAHRSMTHEIWRDGNRTELIDNLKSFTTFVSELSPLNSEGKLSAVLAQFPYFFYHNDQNVHYLERFSELMGDIPTIIEFRNSRWHNADVLDNLKRFHLGYCVVDEPQLPGLMPFYPVSVGDIAYFRLHGRNQNWFNAPMETRYDYLYSKEELERILPTILDLSKKTKKTFVFFNNCHLGSAAKNAAELAKMVIQEEQKG